MVYKAELFSWEAGEVTLNPVPNTHTGHQTPTAAGDPMASSGLFRYPCTNGTNTHS